MERERSSASMRGVLALSISAAIMAGAGPAEAQWTVDAAVNTLVVAKDSGGSAWFESDGQGGLIAVYEESRENFVHGIYAQRLDSQGVPLWGSDDLTLSEGSDSKHFPRICPDGSGGALFVWEDGRLDQRLHAQRVDASGIPQWTEGGTPVTATGTGEYNQFAIPDGTGGMFVVWVDSVPGSTTDVCCQRIDASGARLWGNGDRVVLGNLPTAEYTARLVSDGAGGFVTVWQDGRHESSIVNDLYAQRVDASGTPQWTGNGVPVLVHAGSQSLAELALVDGEHVVAAWEDTRDAQRTAHYAQKIAISDGAIQWTASGVEISGAAGSKSRHRIVADGAGGFFAVWDDERAGNADIYAQRFGPDGQEMWADDGIAVASGSGAQTFSGVVRDGDDGIIIAWGSGGDIYCKRIDGDGVTVWGGSEGLVASNRPAIQRFPRAVPNGHGGMIAVFFDGPSSTPNIYAQMILAGGRLPLILDAILIE